MKSLLGKLVVILIGITIFGYAEAWGADWKFVGKTSDYSLYYDAQSITRHSKNVVRAWQKRYWREEGVFKETFGRNTNLGNSVMLYEIDCGEKKFRILQLTDFSRDDKEMLSRSFSKEWKFVAPDSADELFIKAVCK
jgi:hypothetical protein